MDSKSEKAHSADARVAERPLVVMLVRHAQATSEQTTDALGPPLSPLGLTQAECVAKRLARDRFDHVYSSNLIRAYDTAQAILSHHRSTPCTVTPDLREITHYHFLADQRPPSKAVRKIVELERTLLERFVRHLRRTHAPGQKVLIVCHGNVIRTLLPLFGGLQPQDSILVDISNASITIVEAWASGKAVLKLANCVSHLTPQQVT